MAGITEKHKPLINREARKHLTGKRSHISFAWQDTASYEHAVSFTVAKMMDEDMLAETRAAMTDALANGTDFAAFKARLKPYLMARGWWGQAVMGDPDTGEIAKVQLGSTRRLRTIYHTNLHTAYAAGQWERIQRNKKLFPYLKYIPSDAAEPRESHKPFYGMVLPVDDPFWSTHFPPNGWGCKCNVRALTREQAEKTGISKSPVLKDVEHINTRTGEVEYYPEGVNPSFAHNPGDRLEALLQMAQEKHGDAFARGLLDDLERLQAHMSTQRIFKDSASIIAEGERLYEKYQDIIAAAIQRGAGHEAIAEIMQREGVVTGEAARVVGAKADVDEVIEILRRYPADWVQKSNEAGVTAVQSMNNRAFARIYPNISAARIQKIIDDDLMIEKALKQAAISKQIKPGDTATLLMRNIGHRDVATRLSTHLHEFGHRLQAVMPELDALFARYWELRTKGEPMEKLAEILPGRFRADELTKKDAFPHPYWGKIYGDEDDPQPKEMLTMSFQALLGGDRELFDLLHSDEALFRFTLAVLTRWRAT
ncbi:Phage (Mu-like) virion morphogenesis protein [Cardiobacterium hominis]|uniref:Phage (Mu-like) virion morphogenesis protein n=1 Tax=Cardiobacterium hominis TaxID=2718 RepID=A0A1C3H724_9GAMM|nr:phage minor head protein [Cardiobacterium hominis]SAM71604.1 Phage (Mu-like) virion morphogenesis protein [Cardiobacterium hominis]